MTSNSKYGVSRLCGDMVCSPVYDYIYQFSEYVFAVETNRKVGFMNIKGEIVIPIEYDSLSCRNDKYYKFSNGRAKVVKCLDGDYYEYYSSFGFRLRVWIYCIKKALSISVCHGKWVN